MNDFDRVTKRLREDLGPQLELSIISDRLINRDYEEA